MTDKDWSLVPPSIRAYDLVGPTRMLLPKLRPFGEDPAIARREAREQDARDAVQLAAAMARHRAYVDALPADAVVARAVLQHHGPDGPRGEWCAGCDEGAYAETSPVWPCSTYELVIAL